MIRTLEKFTTMAEIHLCRTSSPSGMVARPVRVEMRSTDDDSICVPIAFFEDSRTADIYAHFIATAIGCNYVRGI